MRVESKQEKILLLSVFTLGKKWGQSVGPVNITRKKKRKERKIKVCYFIWLWSIGKISVTPQASSVVEAKIQNCKQSQL